MLKDRYSVTHTGLSEATRWRLGLPYLPAIPIPFQLSFLFDRRVAFQPMIINLSTHCLVIRHIEIVCLARYYCIRCGVFLPQLVSLTRFACWVFNGLGLV